MCQWGAASSRWCPVISVANKVNKSEETRKVEDAYNLQKYAVTVYQKLSKLVHTWWNYSLTHCCSWPARAVATSTTSDPAPMTTASRLCTRDPLPPVVSRSSLADQVDASSRGQIRGQGICKGVRCPPIFSLSNLINVGWLVRKCVDIYIYTSFNCWH